jgi:hypothetical protein
LARAFSVIYVKTARIRHELDGENRLIFEEHLRRITVRSSDSRRSTIGKLIAGLALGIGLIQGPGAIHNFPQDVRELGGDLVRVTEAVVGGIISLADEIARDMEQALLRN